MRKEVLFMKLRIVEGIEFPEKLYNTEDAQDIVVVKDWFEDNGYNGKYVKSNNSFMYFDIDNADSVIKIPRFNQPKRSLKKAVNSYMENIKFKLPVKESLEDVYSDNYNNDMFAVLKDYLAEEFNPSRWDDLIYDFKEIPFDTGWFSEIIFTNTKTGQRVKFTAEYKDAYDGILYGTYNYGKESTFYSQKEYVDWLAEQVEWRLY